MDMTFDSRIANTGSTFKLECERIVQTPSRTHEWASIFIGIGGALGYVIMGLAYGRSVWPESSVEFIVAFPLGL